MPQLSRLLLGVPLANELSGQERLTRTEALAVLSSDALSSVAYATQETLAILAFAGVAALSFSLPITISIVVLLSIVLLSYRQTIRAYPNGGGSYIVAHSNLGQKPGLVAAAALMIDYVLTAAVSLMAGTQAVTSLLPQLLPYAVPFSLVLLLIVGWVNLRGLRESGRAFSLPTYAFVFSMLLLILMGGLRLLQGEAPPAPAVDAIRATEGLSLLLVLKAFSSGCAAMTGVEAIANGVPVFKAPEARHARQTLMVMGVLLGVMFIGTSSLAQGFHVLPNNDRTVLADLGVAIFGSGSPLLLLLQGSTLLILMLAANTAFADFPRLAALLAQDRYLPPQLRWVGDRLVFQNGIIALVLITGLLVVIFDGDPTNAIPLYSIGVFTAFTLSQAGMVLHWWRERGSGWLGSLLMNGSGALASGLVLLVITVSKFTEGAWVVLVAIPVVVAAFLRLQYVFKRQRQLLTIPANLGPLVVPKPTADQDDQRIALVVVTEVNLAVRASVEYAQGIASKVLGVHVQQQGVEKERLQEQWQAQVGEQPLEILESPYRSIIDPIISYLKQLEIDNPGQRITVVLPTPVARKFISGWLFDQVSHPLRNALRKDGSCALTSLPYPLEI